MKNLNNKIIDAVMNGDIATVRKYLRTHERHPDNLNAHERAFVKKSFFQFFSGSEPKPADNHFDTLAHLAVRMRKNDILQELVDCKLIDVNAYNREGDTPLLLAALYKNAEAVRILAGSGRLEVDKFNKYSCKTAIMIAAENGHEEVATALLNNGANPRLRSNLSARDAAEEAEQFGHTGLAEIIHGYMRKVAFAKQA